MKCNNKYTIGIQDGEETEQVTENLFDKIMKENFPNLKEEVMQGQKTQKVLIKMNPKRPMLRHNTIKMAKFKKQRENLKDRKKQLVTYKHALILIRLSADFSTETIHTRRDWHEIFQ